MKYLLFIWLLIIYPTESWSNICVGIFSLPAFSATDKECSLVLNTLKGVKNPCLSILWKTFGNQTSCLKKILTTYPKLHLRIHAQNCTCHHGTRTCGRGEVASSFRDPRYSEAILKSQRVRLKIRKRAEEIKRFIDEFPTHKFSVSTGLEDAWNREAWKRVFRIHKQVFGERVEHVRTQSHNRIWAYHSVILELHGLFSTNPIKRGQSSCFYSSDGQRLFAGVKRGDFRTIVGRMRDTLREAKRLKCKDAEIWLDHPQGSFLYDRFVLPRKRTLRFDWANLNIVNKFLKEN